MLYIKDTTLSDEEDFEKLNACVSSEAKRNQKVDPRARVRVNHILEHSGGDPNDNPLGGGNS